MKVTKSSLGRSPGETAISESVLASGTSLPTVEVSGITLPAAPFS